MDAEHRQMGINDPALGKQVRKMVASLARRVGEWRSAVGGEAEWDDAVRSSVYAGEPATAAQLRLLLAPASRAVGSGSTRDPTAKLPKGEVRCADDFAHRPRSSIRSPAASGSTSSPTRPSARRSPSGCGLRRSTGWKRTPCSSATAPQVRRRGRVKAALEQSCIATGEPVAEHVDEPFDIDFVPAPVEGRPDEEIELGAEDCDVVFYDGQAIDLGEAIADTLALAMHPYPRSPSAEDALKEAGVLSRSRGRPVRRAGQAQARRDDET